MKVKGKKPGQRACDEKNARGQLCCGHLKRWYTPSEDVGKALKELGQGAEVYRCERCHTLYLPGPGDDSSAGLRFEKRTVNILGAFVRKGLKSRGK